MRPFTFCFGVGVLPLLQLWLLVAVVVFLPLLVVPGSAAEPVTTTTATATTTSTENDPDDRNTAIPAVLLSPFGAYPNPLEITDSERASFAYIVPFPRQCWSRKKTKNSSNNSNSNNNKNKSFVCPYSDHTVVGGKAAMPRRRQLATPAEHQQQQQQQSWLATAVAMWRSRLVRWWRTQAPVTAATLSYRRHQPFYIGRYDEDRQGLYISELFDDDNSNINDNNNSNDNSNNNTSSACTKRTVHTGIDLVGTVDTPVYALTDGIVHSAGYNPALGDYGNVIVVQHFLRNGTATFYALYGHLGHASRTVWSKEEGVPVRQGQVLGWMGNAHEGGGWFVPHVHFQVAQHAPTTPHDMPGAVCHRDRYTALLEYWDPRYVLGELY